MVPHSFAAAYFFLGILFSVVPSFQEAYFCCCCILRVGYASTSWHHHGARYVERLKEEIFHLAVKNRAFERLNFDFFFRPSGKNGKNTDVALTKVTHFAWLPVVFLLWCFVGPKGDCNLPKTIQNQFLPQKKHLVLYTARPQKNYGDVS